MPSELSLRRARKAAWQLKRGGGGSGLNGSGPRGPTMPTIHLGDAPANEDCTQLARTPDFDPLNRLEVAVYAAAFQPATARCRPAAPS